MDREFANSFAKEWVEAWNSHDLDRIMRHYAEDFEMHSPVIIRIANVKSGKIRGKKAVRAYWQKALSQNPSLHFELINCFAGVNSVVIYYKGHRGLAAETLIFNGGGEVTNGYAHYE